MGDMTDEDAERKAVTDWSLRAPTIRQLGQVGGNHNRNLDTYVFRWTP